MINGEMPRETIKKLNELAAQKDAAANAHDWNLLKALIDEYDRVFCEWYYGDLSRNTP